MTETSRMMATAIATTAWAIRSPTPRRTSRALARVAALAMTIGCSAAALAQTINPVEPVIGGSIARVEGVNANGTAAAGYSDNSASVDTANRWTNPGGSVSMGLLPGGVFNSYAEDIDSSGTILTGYGDSGGPTRAFRWTTTSGYQILPIVPGTANFNQGLGISRDGTTVVGVSGVGAAALAFKWSSGNPGVSTAIFGGAGPSVALAASDNGATIVGQLNSAAVTHTGGVTTVLPALPGQIWAAAEAVSSDGSVITGRYSTGGEFGFRWTAATGTVPLPQTPAGCIALRPRAISGDGKLIIGQVVDNSAGFTCFIWTPSGGTQLLAPHLAARGINLTGWQLTDATGISADGTAMCGYGNYNGFPVGWVVRNLPCATVFPIGFSTSLCRGGGANIGSLANLPPVGAIITWKKDGIPFTDGLQPSGSTITGTSTNTITITNMQVGDAGTYTFTMSSAGACEGSASIAFAGAVYAPNIVVQPVDTTACPGQNPFLFSVANSGGGTVLLRWQKKTGPGPNDYTNIFDGPSGNGGSYLGTGTSTFSILNVQPGDATRYRCVFTNTACPPEQTPVISNSVLLTVSGPPVVTGPFDTYQCPGDNDAFMGLTTVPAAGCTFQWQKYVGPTQSSYVDIANGPTGNGGFFGGAQTNQIGIYGFYPGDFNLYRCRVTGPCGQVVTSPAALLTGIPPAAVLVNPVDTTICPGDNDAFFSVTITPGAGYRWQKFVGPGPNDYANIFDGPTGNGGNYSGTGGPSFGVYGCYTGDFISYRCVAIDGCGGPNAISAPATLYPDITPTIVSGPLNTFTCPGGNASLTVNATPAGLSYQWQKITGSVVFFLSNVVDGPTGNGGTYSGAQTPTLNINGVYVPDTINTWYRCLVTGPCGVTSVVSAQATLAFYDNAPVIITQPDSGPLCENGSKQISVAIAPGNYGTVSYQWLRYVPSFPIYVWLSDGPLPCGASVSGSQTLALTLSNVQQQDAGQYYCMITTSCGSLPSAVANLTWCPLDEDCNGVIDASDIFAFLNIWFAAPPGTFCVTPPVGCPGDWDQSGFVDSSDIFAYLNDWFAAGPGSPCP